MTLTSFINKYLGKKVDFEIRQSILDSEINEIWLQRYVSFIKTRNERKLTKEEKTEKHHIVPKCLFDSYKKANKENNYIVLTIREHWIAHLILYKALPNCHSLATTAVFMGITRKDKFNSKEYSKLVNDWKKSASEKAKEFNKKRIGNKQYLEKQRQATKKVFENHPELRNQISEKIRKLWEDEDFRNKMIQKLNNGKNTEKYKKEQSERQKARFKNAKNREMMSEKMKETWKSEEYKNVQKQSHINSWKDPDKRKRILDAKRKIWENEEMREKQSKIITESMKKTSVRLNYAKGRIKIIERSLEKYPNNKELMQKKNKWLLEIQRLEVIS